MLQGRRFTASAASHKEQEVLACPSPSAFHTDIQIDPAAEGVPVTVGTRRRVLK